MHGLKVSHNIINMCVQSTMCVYPKLQFITFVEKTNNKNRVFTKNSYKLFTFFALSTAVP